MGFSLRTGRGLIMATSSSRSLGSTENVTVVRNQIRMSLDLLLRPRR